MNRLAAHPVLPASALPALPGAQPVSTVREAKTAQQSMTGNVYASTPVLQTDGEWEGCDVYVTPPPDMAHGGFVRVLVYAIVEGVGKALVASGFYVWPNLSIGSLVASTPVRIASARATKAKFQVEYFAGLLSFTPNAQNPIVFTAVASDELGPPDPMTGVAPIGVNLATTLNVAQAGVLGVVDAGNHAIPMLFRVVGVRANNRNAAVRSLLLYDAANAAGVAGIPNVAIQVPPGDVRDFVGLPNGARFGQLGFVGSSGLVAYVSTDPHAPAAGAANDMVYEVLVQ